jgi:SAM-dependent methyltransferase
MPSPLRLRQRLCACMMTHGTRRYERLIAPHKQALFAHLTATGPAPTVVEIGPGVGPNLTYLPPNVRYVAFEPNGFMHPRLARAARSAGVAAEIRALPAERLDLPDSSADAVVCTLVLCSVAAPRTVLGQVRRVLRPGGLFLFIEHVAAPRGSALRAVQRALRPAWRLLGDGCEPDRETGEAIGAAGFARVTIERVRVPVPVIAPHLVGWAER